MDWAWLKYAGITIMGLTKAEFWDSSLREVNDMILCHMEINDPKRLKKQKVKTVPFESVF